MTEVFILGCTAPTVDFQQILDPCNCSSYFVQVTSPRPSRDVRTCESGELWNYQAGSCMSQDTVLSQGLCNRRVPWNRCRQATDNSAGDAFRSKMKITCVETGRYDQDIANRISDQYSGFLLSPEAQAANLELMAASFVAGCVVTAFLGAIILTFCGIPSIENSRPSPKKAKIETKTVTTTVEVKKEKKQPRPTITHETRQQHMVVEDDDQIEYENVDLHQNKNIHETQTPLQKPPYRYSKVKKIKQKDTESAPKVSDDPALSFVVTTGVIKQKPSAEPKLLSRPPGTAPKPPVKPSHNKDSPQPKLAMKLPPKLAAKQQTSLNYIHPN